MLPSLLSLFVLILFRRHHLCIWKSISRRSSDHGNAARVSTLATDHPQTLILNFRSEMDSESQRLFHGYQSEHPNAQCVVCRRDYTPRVGGDEVSESITICGDCKSLVADDNEATPPVRNFRRQRRQRRGRTIRYGSSESIEDIFSQHFSQLISLVRQQNHETIQGDDSDAAVSVHTRPSYSPARNWPRSWRRPPSDNDTESLDYGDSLFGESESNISFYGGDSEVSFDGRSLLGREIFTQQEHESHFYTDTDIDPMHAGLDQWNSDEDDDEEDVEWEEVNVDEASVRLVQQHVRNQDSSNSAQNGTTWLRWQVSQADLFADLEEPDVVPVFGNSGDYRDARGFEELLEQFAENDDSRRGAPPASVSAIGSLPNVIISKYHEKNGCLVCAVCKDPLSIGIEAKQLPCLHLYHTACILPWLNARNSCPVCRYELPTDDLEYEDGKRNMGSRTEIHGIQRHNQDESSSDVSSDADVDDARGDELVQAGGGDCVVNSSNRDCSGGGRRWYFIAAAPIVSIALALWFRNSVGERTMCRSGERDSQQPHRSHGGSVTGDGNRRWWSFF